MTFFKLETEQERPIFLSKSVEVMFNGGQVIREAYALNSGLSPGLSPRTDSNKN
jgi:hypothetical protein